MGDLWGNIFGSTGNIGIGQAYQAQQGYNQMSQGYQAQQQQAFNQYAQMQSQIQPRNWVIDGEAMTMMQFADSIWPEPCADKTMFVLKYSKDE